MTNILRNRNKNPDQSWDFEPLNKGNQATFDQILTSKGINLKYIGMIKA